VVARGKVRAQQALSPAKELENLESRREKPRNWDRQ
jgi:hypothetical protein